VSPVGTPNPASPVAVLRQRRAATALDDNQLRLLRDAFQAVLALSDDRGYQYHAGVHGLPLPKYCNVAHGQPTFLAWHRAYLYNFELALRDQVPDVTLPWWDWRTVRDVPEAYATPQRPDGTGNPLFSVRINDLALAQARANGGQRDQDLADYPDTYRDPGLPGAPPLPTTAEIEALLDVPQFLDFQTQLEDKHGDVHVWVGGHMSNIPFAAYDPIFWAHHSMIDRIWRLWQLRHAQTALPEGLLERRQRAAQQPVGECGLAEDREGPRVAAGRLARGVDAGVGRVEEDVGDVARAERVDVVEHQVGAGDREIRVGRWQQHRLRDVAFHVRPAFRDRGRW
jgi:tyrosinase